MQKVIAVASGGGHWIQLLRLREAFEDNDVVFVTTDAMFASELAGWSVHVVPDSSRWTPLRLLATAFTLLAVMLRERPDVVISTGAAPGFLAILYGRLLGAKTVWVDSIANAGELSLSGRLVGRLAGLWLTQWPHLATEDGPHYAGRVL